jgi:predicted outer membrane repeat protein
MGAPHSRSRPRRLAAWLLAILAVPAMSPASAAVLDVTECTDTVPGGAAGELRKAVTDAAGGDTIRVPACTITLHGALDVIVVEQVIHLRGSGRGRTILESDGQDRVLHVHIGAGITLADVTIRGGRTSQGGGGILVEAFGTLELSDSEVVGNEATIDGGAILNLGRATIRRTTVAGNRAGSQGGGIHSSKALTAVVDSTIADNEAALGGGVATFVAGQLRVEQTTISGNRATGPLGGGGILVDHPVTVLWSTVTGNHALAGEGGGLLLAGPGAAVVGSSIVALNTPGDCAGTGPLTSLGHNLQGDGSCSLALSTDRTDPDPGLGPLAAGGGPTSTHGLRPGSPALDAGDALGCPGTDQRGVPRPQGAACDAGAVERRLPTAPRVDEPAGPTDPR